jgi:hypothetical protein
MLSFASRLNSREMTMKRTLIGLAVVVGLLPGAIQAEDFALKDGDRVVLLGSTIIEREQRYGYWELMLTRRYPDKNIVFRNLGWSGDTVFGQARASFGSTADGFRHLKDHVAAVKPTVILIAYGTNEAFEGEAGLPKFQQGLNTLLDALAPNKARIVLLSPPPIENLGKPLPDPTAQNKNIKLYRETIQETAKKRDLGYIELSGWLEKAREAFPTMRVTDNGMHFTNFGYWYTGALLQTGIAGLDNTWQVTLDAQGKLMQSTGAKIEKAQAAPIRFTATDEMLPYPPSPAENAMKMGAFSEFRRLAVQGLPQGNHRLTIDGRAIVTASAAEWHRGVKLQGGPEFDQAEKLRAAIIEKNRQYFHRWRPQNETYLFGFRKQEQGKNAVEIPQFDPFVVKYEEEIAKLRVPVSHTYEIAPVRGDSK